MIATSKKVFVFLLTAASLLTGAQAQLKTCPAGTYFGRSNGRVTCTPCPPGTINNLAGRRKKCRPCPEGRFANNLSTKCLKLKNPPQCSLVGLQCTTTKCCPGFQCDNGTCVDPTVTVVEEPQTDTSTVADTPVVEVKVEQQCTTEGDECNDSSECCSKRCSAFSRTCLKEVSRGVPERSFVDEEQRTTSVTSFAQSCVATDRFLKLINKNQAFKLIFNDRYNPCTYTNLKKQVWQKLGFRCRKHSDDVEMMLLTNSQSVQEASEKIQTMCREANKPVTSSDIQEFSAINPYLDDDFMEDYLAGGTFLNGKYHRASLLLDDCLWPGSHSQHILLFLKRVRVTSRIPWRSLEHAEAVTLVMNRP